MTSDAAVTRALRIANLIGPQAGMLMRSQPSRPTVVDLAMSEPLVVPPECNALFILYDRRSGDPNATRPVDWPGAIEWVQLASAGIDEYPAWVFEAPCVTSATGTTAGVIAEYAMAVILAHEKRIPDLFAHGVADWPRVGDYQTRPMGTLQGKTLGIVGFGAIGTALAALALPFGMKVVTARRSEAPLGRDDVTLAPLRDVLQAADHLVLAAPLTAQTRHLMNDETFALLKPTAHLVNVARGPLVDHAALLRALDAGRPAAATLDVTEPEPLPDGHPLYAHPAVRISPHQSYNSPRVMESVAKFFLEQIARFTAGRDLLNVVDYGRGY